MEVLKPKPKLLLPLSFELNQEHYLWELSRKKYCNKTALGVALTTAAVSNGLIIEENEVFMSRIRPDINYCKIYILNIDEIEVYQASISDFLVAKIRAKESFNGVLVFDFLGNASELINEEVTLLRIFFKPFNGARKIILTIINHLKCGLFIKNK
jgi:hypothetical protein